MYLGKVISSCLVLSLTITTTLNNVMVSAQDSNVNPHYAALLNNSMWFYEAQRSGKLPSDNRISW